MRGLRNGHFGLIIMQERMHRFGGTVMLTSKPGEGTVVEASVPVHSAKKKPLTSALASKDD